MICLTISPIYTVNYYDDYDFLLNLDNNFKNQLDYEEMAGYGKRYIDSDLKMKTPMEIANRHADRYLWRCRNYIWRIPQAREYATFDFLYKKGS